jgi:hypothetical protein
MLMLILSIRRLSRLNCKTVTSFREYDRAFAGRETPIDVGIDERGSVFAEPPLVTSISVTSAKAWNSFGRFARTAEEPTRSMEPGPDTGELPPYGYDHGETGQANDDLNGLFGNLLNRHDVLSTGCWPLN